MTVRQPLVVANWKLNGDLDLVNEMAAALNNVNEMVAKVVICPPFLYIPSIFKQAAKFSVGAQNLSEQAQGAYTGEVSASMLVEGGAQYVIIGHSERRALYGETNQLVAAKFATALQHKLIPILCLGETAQQREQQLTEKLVREQLMAVIDTLGVTAFANAVIAYEPVWAIGTGNTATAEQAQQVHQFIRETVAEFDPLIAATLPILYGGSVNRSNSKELFAQADIDGGLVGGASLKVAEFLAIGQSV